MRAHNHSCVCEHATQLLHLHLASSTCSSSSSRDQQTSLPFGRRHTLNAAPRPLVCSGESLAHCHPSQPPSHEALAPHTLPWALSSSMKCVWHIGCKGPRHTALCCAPLCVFLALSFVCLVFGRRPMLLLLLLLEALYSLHALCGDEFGQHVSTCDDFKQGRACTAHHAPSLSSLVITF